VTHSSLSPDDVLPWIDSRSWTYEELPSGRTLVWSQHWAAPLRRRHLLTALVLSDPSPGGLELSESLEDLSDWTVPRVVVSRDESMDAAAQIAAAGAQFLPSSRIECLGDVVRNTLAHRSGLRSSSKLIAAK
jgi:hypothetical protein